MANDSGERLAELYDLSDLILQDLLTKTSAPHEAMEIIAFMVTGLWHTQFKARDVSWREHVMFLATLINQRHRELSKALERGDIEYEILGPKRAQ